MVQPGCVDLTCQHLAKIVNLSNSVIQTSLLALSIGNVFMRTSEIYWRVPPNMVKLQV